ncbi:HAMP domain-containing sensor histidine kinase [uncultured Microscilla sp.]|uniref:HAMP domain-containing sensor histidine kinase n=1 Tax=uncultured Microscilla sp. TaxID=432653 RepID=UPI002635E7F5|nr:HAMP domain-containing sensor histidine kinase [uncultured Microscilla sp.]
MMASNSRKYFNYIYITLCVVTLLGALGMGYIVPSKPKTIDEQRVKEITLRVQREIAAMKEESGTVAKAILTQGLQSFANGNFKQQYHCYIYKQSELKYWTNYRFVPDYQDIKGQYLTEMFKFRNGYYLALKTIIAHPKEGKLEMFSLLPVYTQYPISNAYLKSGYNAHIISDNTVKISLTKNKRHRNIFSKNKQFLFSLEPSGKPMVQQTETSFITIILISLSVFFLGLQVNLWAKQLVRSKKFELGFLLFAAYLVGVRLLMLQFGFPGNFTSSQLFSPHIYASSELSPSIGDLLINVSILVGLVVYFSGYYFRSRSYRYLINLPYNKKQRVSIILVILSFFALQLTFYILQTIIVDSQQINVDITENIEVTSAKLVAGIVFLLVSGFYFFATHIFSRLFIRLNLAANRYVTRDSISVIVLFVLGTGAYVLISFFAELLQPMVLIINGCYFAILVAIRLPRQLYRFKYLSTIYMFLGALACASMGAYVVVDFGEREAIEKRRKIGDFLIAENDLRTEFYLKDAIKSIKQDSTLTTAFNDSTSQDKQIRAQVVKHLGNDFNKYLVDILLFSGKDGNTYTNPPINKVNTQDPSLTKDDVIFTNYFEYKKKYDRIFYETEHPDIFFINDLGANLIKQYLGFIAIGDKKSPKGYIILNFKQKRAVSTNVYPELLVDKQFLRTSELKKYSYAVFEKNKLIYSAGTYNYERDFDIKFLANDQAITKGLVHKNFKHLVTNGGRKKFVVISKEHYPLSQFFSNFSFLFLLLVLFITNIILLFSLLTRVRKIKVNFATRIQFYLNVAFFLPLITVSLAMLSLIDSSYQNDFDNAFFEKTETVATNILPYVESYQEKSLTQSQLFDKLIQIGQYLEVDINIFTPQGKLITSTQPSIYEKYGLLSKYLNYKAYQTLSGNQVKKVLLSESVGQLNYKSVYIPLKSYETKKTLGILSIPFFDSKNELDEKMVNVLSTIMNIFTTIFIVFLIVSYFASQILTDPLRLITQKIRKTTLHEKNEPLEWNSKDEIGLMVDEYNKMLINLEKSKEALARSEKESAWREMARQVAHEIKNPLTPMKLTLQMLEMRLQQQEEEVRETFARYFKTLLTQVDTLSDIATSFSSFAKMPIPKSERFEISAVLKETVNLYTNNKNIDLETDIASGEFFVMGDQKLMGRIFTNLVLNAIQAVPSDIRPQVTINLTRLPQQNIRIEVKDNGSGIPEDIRKKVFVINFTTKESGSGIGLAVAKRGIEHAGGHIWFETEEDKGTSFFIDLPLME